MDVYKIKNAVDNNRRIPRAGYGLFDGLLRKPQTTIEALYQGGVDLNALRELLSRESRTGYHLFNRALDQSPRKPATPAPEYFQPTHTRASIIVN